MFNEKAKINEFAKSLARKGATKEEIKTELTKYVRNLPPRRQAILAVEQSNR